MPRIETIVFLSLVLDLFAFTIPLPLFPRIIEWYTTREISNPNGFLSRTLQFVSFLRSLVYKSTKHSQRWDIVLLGGLMGSVFSTLQFFVSPRIGSLSDKYGRKRILLLTMAGNILSAIVWIQSTSFASYMLSRVIGGLSEGNVQLAIAILSDVTTPQNRSRALAQVGIAFAICFCIGPPIGAYFASRPLPPSIRSQSRELNVYATPAFITFVLLTAETIFLMVALPETRGKVIHSNSGDRKIDTPNGDADAKGKAPSIGSRKHNAQERIQRLATLRKLHFYFLCIFSGVEFTLTFLTFDLLDWNNNQNGKLIGVIGIFSALLQGGYVRRSMSKIGEFVVARQGVTSCAIALSLLMLLPYYVQNNYWMAMKLLYAAAICMAFTSATVVNALTAYASLQCDDIQFDQVTGKPLQENPQLAKGKALGKFRSSGQLGRAIGPVLACGAYWTFGPTYTYAASAMAMFALSAAMRSSNH
ncbi:hypothetical protein AMATHDRAFT_73941 [Amanita thiersii Skay4041]|uniref:Major facilitator superfamily (MFS) profile domain-containing protein n=1 Tax=Amanita thiersii Skay4041 TaxID=703135 RepID=A0A2A9NPA7_9AGAR|nr:hypothetical protein AMATHDRAFT_73941 [Amanita thiersii Skay4041]